jgi:hypothetical protein
MNDDPPRSEAERTALTVFHDLQLAHARKNNQNPSPTFFPPNRPSSPAHRPVLVDADTITGA